MMPHQQVRRGVGPRIELVKHGLEHVALPRMRCDALERLEHNLVLGVNLRRVTCRLGDRQDTLMLRASVSTPYLCTSLAYTSSASVR